MKILMLGWELAPFISGGLGIAIAGLAERLVARGHSLTLVLPYKLPITSPYFDVIWAGDKPEYFDFYSSYSSVSAILSDKGDGQKNIRLGSLVDEAYLYAQRLKKMLKDIDYEIIHAHDWMTMQAALTAQKENKPFVAHIHSTEFYRSGGQGANPEVFDIEYEGLHKADRVIAISSQVGKVVQHDYTLGLDKIRVVHNGIEWRAVKTSAKDIMRLKEDYNIVLSLSRITIQKGLDYLLQAAKLVCKHLPNTLFVFVGKGDMQDQLMDQAIEDGLGKNVIFTGWLDQEEAAKYYQAADLFLMPSVAEPFGLVALEAALFETPVIVSKTCGLNDVFKHSLKVDFWDIKLMASHIISVLEHRGLKQEMIANGLRNAKSITWEKSAEGVENVYRELIP